MLTDKKLTIDRKRTLPGYKDYEFLRSEGLKYIEIAKKLNISIKTVETQMSLAIKSLRTKLQKYNTFFLFFL